MKGRQCDEVMRVVVVMMMVTKMKRVKVEMLSSFFRRLLNLAVKVLGRWTKFGGGGSKFEADIVLICSLKRDGH